MKEVFNRLKPVLLLVSMTLVSVCIVWVTNQFRSTSMVIGESIAFETPDIVLEEPVIDSSIPEKVEEVKSEGLVLAAGSNLQCRGQDYTDIRSESICHREADGGKVGFLSWLGAVLTGQDFVSVNAAVVLTEVSVPLELLSGIEVKNSNRLISTETPTLKAAGEQIDEVSGNVLLPPGTQINEYKGWEEDKPFQFDYSTGFVLGSNEITEEGKIGVEDKITNDCEYCNNKSNVNPDKSNKLSEFMLDSLYRYPGEKDEIEEEEIIESCSDSDSFVNWENDDYKACKLSLPERAIEFVKSIPGWTVNLKCTLLRDTNDPDCINIENIVIIMSSPFGSDIDCKEGACTNAYMTKRNNVAMAPDVGSGGKFYYLTPCEAMIQGRFGVDNVKCAWDMTHLYRERKVNEFDDLPGVESTPTDSEYNQFLLEDVQGQRGNAVSIN